MHTAARLSWWAARPHGSVPQEVVLHGGAMSDEQVLQALLEHFCIHALAQDTAGKHTPPGTPVS